MNASSNPILASLARQFAGRAIDRVVREQTAEQEVLNRIRRATVDHDEYLAALRQAAMIAEAGGVSDGTLRAVLHAVARGDGL